MKRFISTAIGISVVLTACSSTALSVAKPEAAYAGSSDQLSTTPKSEADTSVKDLLSYQIHGVISVTPYDIQHNWERLSPDAKRFWQEQRDAILHAAEVARKERIRTNRIERLEKALDAVVSRVGLTPYVFGGSTTRGWDCSGLVMWTFNKLGISVPHSASAQLGVGKRVSNPRRGDIVVWGGGYHSGIYLGNGKVVNALNPRVDTNIVNVDYLYGDVAYVRVYDY